MRTWLWFAIYCLASVPAAFARGSITMTLTPYSSPGMGTAAVRIDLTITDNGGVPGCSGIQIVRRSVFPCGSPQVVQTIPRQLGTRSLQFFDTVPANTSYAYTARGSGACNAYDFDWEFDPHGWGFSIEEATAVGPDLLLQWLRMAVLDHERRAGPVHPAGRRDSRVVVPETAVSVIGCDPSSRANGLLE